MADTPTPAPTDLPVKVLLERCRSGSRRVLNCEFQTATDLAWYYGRPFTWEEIYQYVGHERREPAQGVRGPEL